ncbi:nitroreductase/quinone reductase family protein [Cryptosporangium minutisporangium]|uniref:Nitroreductase/quinone reductase family protein n=1 Tax=Cryptosporangium minutisporangium TaxID=113569 RepID=A0ABP6STK2_9ACTN
MTTLPRWLPTANRVVRALNRANLRLGTIHVLTVPGRVSGKPRATPISPLRVNGHRYVIAGLVDAQWARNVRAAGVGTLAHGRRTEPVRLTEVTDPDLRRAVMHAFPSEVPHGVPFFVRIGLVRGADPDEFAAAADQVAVFRVDSERPGSHEGSRAG